MFTGIIQDIGEIVKIKKEEDKKFFVLTNIDYKKLKVGSSICCNGICLTIIKREKKKKKNWFVFTASKETLNRSNLNFLTKGSSINLETSLKLNDEISGHLVLGHIDNIAKIIEKKYVGSSLNLSIELPFNLRNFISVKGSIAINGVSLTINDISKNSFKVNIIPHTLKTTIFNKVRINDLVNIEVDMVARYVSHYIDINKL